MQIYLSLLLCASVAATALPSAIRKASVGREDCNCLPIAKCPSLLKFAQERKFDKLREQTRCGYEKLEPLLCCPDNFEEAETDTKGEQEQENIGGNVSNEDGQNKICMKELHDLKATEGHQCGTPELAVRVTGGEDADSHEWPWAAAIAYNVPEPEYLCGGALIHEQYVMTAAHCVLEKNGTLNSNLAHVFLGHADFNDPCGAEVKIESATPHPDYSSKLSINDIALLKLVRPVEMGPTINTLCLPSPDEKMEDIEKPYVVGWGYTDVADGGEHEVSPNILQELELRVVPTNNCTEVYGEILQSQICAEGLSFGQDSCNGDSGGPVMSLNSDFQYVARGVVSFGGARCDNAFPGVYTRVSSYIGWIHSVIDER